jgi:hypothetical protein
MGKPKQRPAVVMSIEDRFRLRKERKAQRKSSKGQGALESSAAEPSNEWAERGKESD